MPPWWFWKVFALEEVDLARLDPRSVRRIAGRAELEEGGAGAVAGGSEDPVAAHQRCGDVGHVVGDAVVAPEEAAVRRPDADYATPQELDVLLDPGAVRDDDRAVGGAVAAAVAELRDRGSPQDLAAPPVEGDQGGVRSAWRDHHAVTVDQGRLGEAPVDAGARHRHGAPHLGEAAPPAHRPGVGGERDQVSLGAQRVHGVSGDAGRRA
jgi:hypothetical protein